MALKINTNKLVYTNNPIVRIIIVFLCGAGLIAGGIFFFIDKREVFFLIIALIIGVPHIIYAFLIKTSVLVIDKNKNTISRNEKTWTGLFAKQITANLDDILYICYNIRTDKSKRGATRSSHKSIQFFAMIKDHGRFLLCPVMATPRAQYKKLGNAIADFIGVEFTLSAKTRQHNALSGEVHTEVANETLAEDNYGKADSFDYKKQ